MSTPRYPDVAVDLRDHANRPVASIALVRRALQHAGHRDAARSFTEEAMGEDEAGILAVAARYVTLLAD